MERQPDIEIYVRGCSTERLVAWLESVVGPLGPLEAAGAAIVYPSRIGPVVLTPRIKGGPFVSVWFNSPNTPWATDVDCARQVARELCCVVRCDPGLHFPEAPLWASDQFLDIADGVEKIVTWECAEPGAETDSGRDAGLS